jgi:sugar lactone lactonase YvrE
MSRSFSPGFRHRLGRAAAVVGLVATIGFVSAPSTASAATVPLVGSTFSISDPGSLSGTSGQAITPVQFVASNVDASTAPATTSITWVAGQLPAGLALSATGQLSGTLNASIPGGVYDVRVVATEKVVTKWRGRRIVAYAAADFATTISVAGPSVTVSHQTVIASGLNTPSGVAVGSSGHVFVADTLNNRVVKMDADGSNQTVIGSGFRSPFGVAVDSSGHVFVADTDNSRVVKMDADGSNQTTVSSGFAGPYGVAVDSSGHVFVADTGNSRVVKMDVDGSNQTVIGSGFSYPYGVAADSSGHVFVADTDNSRVVKMDADGSNQTAFESGFFYPYGVGVDSSGHVFVAGNGRVVTLDARIPDQTIPSVEAGQPLVATQLVGGAVDPSTPPRVTSVKWFASSLPAGLRLSSSGVLSGTPLAALDAGRYSIYVVATQRVTTKIGTVTSVTTKTTSRVIQIVIT